MRKLLAIGIAPVIALSAQCGGTQPPPKKNLVGKSCGKNGIQTSYKGRIYVCKGVRKNHSGHWELKPERKHS